MKFLHKWHQHLRDGSNDYHRMWLERNVRARLLHRYSLFCPLKSNLGANRRRVQIGVNTFMSPWTDQWRIYWDVSTLNYATVINFENLFHRWNTLIFLAHLSFYSTGAVQAMRAERARMLAYPAVLMEVPIWGPPNPEVPILDPMGGMEACKHVCHKFKSLPDPGPNPE